MATLEENTWKTTVAPYLPIGTTTFPKAKQQALANALQQWTALCINQHLSNIFGRPFPERWEAAFKGRDFLGAMRRQEVDVWVRDDEAGLVLAVDPKHFQSKSSLKKNWKNGHNDLIAFSTNLHERYPLCAVGGVISFPASAADQTDLNQIYGICSRSIPRERPSNAHGKFEGFALAVYDDSGALVWPFNANASRLRPEAAFNDLATILFARTVALVK